jgi:hypothetical protein
MLRSNRRGVSSSRLTLASDAHRFPPRFGSRPSTTNRCSLLRDGTLARFFAYALRQLRASRLAIPLLERLGRDLTLHQHLCKLAALRLTLERHARLLRKYRVQCGKTRSNQPFQAAAAGSAPASTSRRFTGSTIRLSPSSVRDPRSMRSPGSPNTTRSATENPAA